MPITALWTKLRALLQRRQKEADLEAELAFHLSEEAESREESGLPPRTAYVAARRSLGNITAVKEDTRSSWGFTLAETAAQDLRIAARSLRKNPGFSLVAILILGLGIGASTAVFSVVNAVVLKPLAFRDPGRIVSLTSLWKKTGVHGFVSLPDFNDWRAQAASFESLAFYSNREGTVNVESEAHFAGLAVVSSDFFRVFGVAPALGRSFRAAETVSGGGGSAVVSDSFWRTYLGTAPSVLGKTIRIAGRSVAIVGVMPTGFRFPEKTEIWIPAGAVIPIVNPNRGGHNYHAVGRLKAGVDVARAQSEMTLIGERLENQYAATNGNKNIAITPLADDLTGGLKPMLYLLLGAVSLLLLISCGNVANLLLAKAAARQRELGVRTALGAGRARLVRQLTTESLVLGIASWLTGVFIAYAGARALVSLAPANVPRLEESTIDLSVLAFAALATLIACLLFGVAPAFRATRVDPNRTLTQAGTRGPQGIGVPLRQGLVVVEVALSVVLLTGAGLLIRSFAQLSNVPLGFESRQVLVMETSNPTFDPQQATRVVQTYETLLQRAASIPGVVAVAAARVPPGEVSASGAYEVDQPGLLSVKSPTAVYSVVSPGAFAVLGIPLRLGRDFSATDTEDAPLTAIVNETLAKRAFPGEDPRGHQIVSGLDNLKPMTIVGVVGDIRQLGPAGVSLAEIYMPYQQHPLPSTAMRILARTSIPPDRIVPALRQQAKQLAPQMPVKFTTMEARMSENVALPRFRTLLLAIFAGIAVVLAMAGVYGVVSFLVAQRTQEIGLRMALGAGAGQVATMVLSQGGRMAAFGLLLGVAAAAGLTRLLTTLLFEVKPFDPATFAAVGLLVAVVTVAACFLPAWRASRIDPLRALRQE